MECRNNPFFVNKPKYIQFYTWENNEYREYMTLILINLEPRFEKAGTILYDELDEVNEVLFMNNGEVDVGFKINGQAKFIIRFHCGTIIGAYNCTFSKRTSFIY